MCLIAIALDPTPRYRLVVAANRDEFYARPSAPARFWRDVPGLLAGRDLKGGGTWLGVTRSGRFAVLTNFRDASPSKEGAPSRGELVVSFLKGGLGGREFLDELVPRAGGYAGFSLLLFDGSGLSSFANRNGGARALPAGLYGLSNNLLEAPWPKVTRVKERMENALKAAGDGRIEPARLLSILADRTRAQDARLPSTGLPLEWERILSAPFIAGPGYGTRASTVVLFERTGLVRFVERSFGPAGAPGASVDAAFTRRGS